MATPLATSSGAPEPRAGIWTALQAEILQRITREQFETWFRRATLVRMDSESVALAVQNEFTRSWLRDYYEDVLQAAVQATLGARRRVEILVDAELMVAHEERATLLHDSGSESSARDSQEGSSQRVQGQAVEPDGAPQARVRTRNEERSARPQRATAPRGSEAGKPPGGTPVLSLAHRPPGLLLDSDFVLNPKYTFENFVVGPCNRFGHAAAMGAAEQPGKNYNPFFLHGNVGVGKTHLLQAVCFLILERAPESRILYLSCETFVNHFINALEHGDLTPFRTKYRSVDVLVVDDIHLLANKERTQEEFFHTFNTLYNSGKQIVLSSDSPPKDIPTLQERLVSRFKWGMVTEIEPPCFETRMAIIRRKSRDQGVTFPDDVAELIAENIKSNVRELEGAVTRLVGYGKLAGKPLTIDLARKTLGDALQSPRGLPTMVEIAEATCTYFGVKLTDLQSRRRTKSIAYPRQIAMYISRQLTRHSLEEIGAYFGGRDHSTVLYAVMKIKTRCNEDGECKQQVEQIMRPFSGNFV